jgi:RimJ/RimL family protein N-acetyltransferase
VDTYSKVELLRLDRFNWVPFSELELEPHQTDFVPSALFAVAESRFEPQSLLWGITLTTNSPPESKAVGLLVENTWSGIIWLNRLLVAAPAQGQGIGKQALQLWLQEVQTRTARTRSTVIRTTVHAKNHAALALFEHMGFQLHGILDDTGERILEYTTKTAVSRDKPGNPS